MPVVPELRLRWTGNSLAAVPVSIANDADCFAWVSGGRVWPEATSVSSASPSARGRERFVRDGRIATDGPGVPPNGELWDLPYLDGCAEDYTAGHSSPDRGVT